MTEAVGLIDATALRNYADRILNLHAQRKDINADMGAVFSEAKVAGFVPAMIRDVVREMEMESDARDTFFRTQDAYRRALGLLADTPLGEAAIERAGGVVVRPRPFAEQPLHRRRGRPRKGDRVDDALSTLDPLGAAE
jgi:uncharacterized protein (UPF0335 family)